jgi:ketosteroid isomerase-like protein
MTEENLDVVRRAVEANCSDDLERRIPDVLALFDPSCEYTSVTAAVDPKTYRGHEGIRQYMSDLAARWGQWRSEAEEVFEVDPETVYATVRFRAVGKDSGVPVEARLGTICVVSGARIVRGQTYSSREHALDAVGLEE